MNRVREALRRARRLLDQEEDRSRKRLQDLATEIRNLKPYHPPTLRFLGRLPMDEPREVPNQITTLSLGDGLHALELGWKCYFGAPPDSKDKLLTLAAQTILETGWFRAMHCFNFGNVKARPGGRWSWTFFACNEVLSVAQANQAVRSSTAAAPAMLKSYTKDGDAIVWFYPKHPACCFRAFETAEEGAADHVALLNSPRFEPAWDRVDAGDVHGFALQLGRLGYYTADATQYAASCAQILAHLKALPFELDPVPDVPPELAARAIALRDLSMRDDAFVEHEYPEMADDQA